MEVNIQKYYIDSERDGKDGTIFRKKKFTKNRLYYIEIDLHNDVFCHYQPWIEKDYNKKLFMF